MDHNLIMTVGAHALLVSVVVVSGCSGSTRGPEGTGGAMAAVGSNASASSTTTSSTAGAGGAGGAIGCSCMGNDICCGDICVDIVSDPMHCGSCNNPCDPGQTCSFGECS